MIERACISQLMAWCNERNGRKPLLIRGARQVGKTTIVRMLAAQCGLNLIEVNFEKPWRFVQTLESLNPRRTVEAIAFELNVDIHPENSLIFFDEVQACPKALELLRYFYEEAPEYRVVATGSLLEFALAEPGFSVPVGRIQLFHLGPLTFEEFLQATGEDKALSLIRNFQAGDTIPGPAHDKMNHLVRLYSITGGMPQAVDTYASTRSFTTVERIKADILDTFRLDFNKYQGRANVHLLTLVFDALPRLMGRKLIFSKIDSNYRSSELAKAVEQLYMARVITKVFNSHANGVPLGAEKNDRYFKIMLLDTGLLLTQLRLVPTDIDLVPELNLVNSGILAEQFIGQQLHAMQSTQREPELYYWAREERAASAEVDFVFETETRNIVPVEVKAGSTGSLRSLHLMVQLKSLPVAVRFCSDLPTLFREKRGTVKGTVDFLLLSLPHYLVQQMPRILNTVLNRKEAST